MALFNFISTVSKCYTLIYALVPDKWASRQMGPRTLRFVLKHQLSHLPQRAKTGNFNILDLTRNFRLYSRPQETNADCMISGDLVNFVNWRGHGGKRWRKSGKSRPSVSSDPIHPSIHLSTFGSQGQHLPTSTRGKPRCS